MVVVLKLSSEMSKSEKETEDDRRVGEEEGDGREEGRGSERWARAPCLMVLMLVLMVLMMARLDGLTRVLRSTGVLRPA